MTTRRRCGGRRGQPLRTRRAGSVAPLTTRDRHTGDADLASPDATGQTAADGSVGESVATLAGSREEKWRTPREGSGEGRLNVGAARHTPAATESGPILSSYLMDNGPSQDRERRRRRGPDSFARREWEREVEAKTRFHRVARASHHMERAQEARRAGRSTTAVWHQTRGGKQLCRFDQVRDCGGEEVVMRCEACGHEVKRIEVRCGHFRICVHCRGARADRERFRFREARERALARAQHLLRAGIRGGRWSEKFLTFTVPHFDVEQDIKLLPKAWRKFRKLLFEHLRSDRQVSERDMACVAYLRVLEVTAGRNSDGHAHLHVYLLAPYLPKEWLKHLWGEVLVGFGRSVPTAPLSEVLAAADGHAAQLRRLLVTRRGAKGRALETVYRPVVHVEECYGDIENELVKYLVKDLERDEDGSEKLMDPALFARVYAGLEGVRTFHASARFWVSRKGSCKCGQCGSKQTTRERVSKPTHRPGPAPGSNVE